MPAWISVYCTKPVNDVVADVVLLGVRQNDYWTLAEQYDIDDELVDPALTALRISADNRGLQLHYGQGKERPIAIHFWTSPEQVKEEIEEVEEFFCSQSNETSRIVLAHMRNVISVVGIEIGFTQLKDMGIVFAYEIARWFAANRSGIIRGEDDCWSRIKNNCYIHL